jgi:hypothetical protein
MVGYAVVLDRENNLPVGTSQFPPLQRRFGGAPHNDAVVHLQVRLEEPVGGLDICPSEIGFGRDDLLGEDSGVGGGVQHLVGTEDVGHRPLGHTLLGLHGAVEEPGDDFREGDISIVRVQEVLSSLRLPGG